MLRIYRYLVVLVVLANVMDAQTVTTIEDVIDANDDALSLREAIRTANATPGPDAIVLPEGEYRLSIAGVDEDQAETGDLDITDELILRGAGEGLTVVDGREIDRVFQIFHQVHVTFEGLTIRGGRTSTKGGGIHSTGWMTLRNCEVIRNYAIGTSSETVGGGGIYSEGSLTLLSSVVSFNMASRPAAYNTTVVGGGIHFSGVLSLQNSRVDSNLVAAYLAQFAHASGGGIAHTEGFGLLDISDSSVSYNVALAAPSAPWGTSFASGGGIFSTPSMRLVAKGSVFESNAAISSGKYVHASGGFLQSVGTYTPPTTLTFEGSRFRLNRAMAFDTWNDAQVTSSGGAFAYSQAQVDFDRCILVENVALATTEYDKSEAVAQGGVVDNLARGRSKLSTVDSIVSSNRVVARSEKGRAYAAGGAFSARGGGPGTVSWLAFDRCALESNVVLAEAGPGRRAIARGGAILRDIGFQAISVLFVEHTTVADNAVFGTDPDTAQGGGIFQLVKVRSTGVTKLLNATVSGNSAPSGSGFVGATLAPDTISILLSVSSTWTENDGPAIELLTIPSPPTQPQTLGKSYALLRNTIVAGNVGGDVIGDVTTFGGNLLGEGTNVGGILDGSFLDQVGTNLVPLDPKLGPLQDNGGPTRTHALLADSPAIDHGINGPIPATDQRLGPRVLDGNGNGKLVIDTGSYERDP